MMMTTSTLSHREQTIDLGQARAMIRSAIESAEARVVMEVFDVLIDPRESSLHLRDGADRIPGGRMAQPSENWRITFVDSRSPG